jgi:small subunit ribosomal protein S9
MAANKPLEYAATGRRKTSVARVWLSAGDGVITVNERPMKEFFRIDTLCSTVQQPLKATNTLQKYSVSGTVRGGGIAGQAGAMRLGIARALVLADETLKPVLKEAGFLTRDPRMKERLKPGQPGARKRFQFSKR